VARDESSDLREFIREITLGIERAMRRLDRAIEVMDRKTDLLAEEIRLQRGYLEDILAENRAQREALFRILDRLDNGGPAPAT
jgi:hypothetical protein